MEERTQQGQQCLVNFNSVLLFELAPCEVTEGLIVTVKDDRVYFRLPGKLRGWFVRYFNARTTGIGRHKPPPGYEHYRPVYGYQQPCFRFPLQVIFWMDVEDVTQDVICEVDFDGFGAVYGAEQVCHSMMWLWQRAPKVVGKPIRKTNQFAVMKHLRKRYAKAIERTGIAILDVREGNADARSV